MTKLSLILKTLRLEVFIYLLINFKWVYISVGIKVDRIYKIYK